MRAAATENQELAGIALVGRETIGRLHYLDCLLIAENISIGVVQYIVGGVVQFDREHVSARSVDAVDGYWRRYRRYVDFCAVTRSDA